MPRLENMLRRGWDGRRLPQGHRKTAGRTGGCAVVELRCSVRRVRSIDPLRVATRPAWQSQHRINQYRIKANGSIKTVNRQSAAWQSSEKPPDPHTHTQTRTHCCRPVDVDVRSTLIGRPLRRVDHIYRLHGDYARRLRLRGSGADTHTRRKMHDQHTSLHSGAARACMFSPRAMWISIAQKQRELRSIARTCASAQADQRKTVYPKQADGLLKMCGLHCLAPAIPRQCPERAHADTYTKAYSGRGRSLTITEVGSARHVHRHGIGTLRL